METPINSSFTNFAFMRKLPSFTNFATSVHALIAMEIFHYMHDSKSPTRVVSDMNAVFSCSFITENSVKKVNMNLNCYLLATCHCSLFSIVAQN